MKAKILLITAIVIWLGVSVTGQTPVSKDFAQQFPFSTSKRVKAGHAQQQAELAARGRKTFDTTQKKMASLAPFSGWRLDSLKSFYYDYGTSAWVEQYKALHEYDSVFRSAVYTSYYFDQMMMKYVPESRELYTFTPQGDISILIYMNYDELMSQFVNSYKDEYYYATTGELELRLSSDWNYQTSQFDPYGRMEYNYDSLGRISEIVFYYWDEFALAWAKGSRDLYNYNAAGQLLSVDGFYWLDFQQMWYPASLTEYTYHVSGKLAMEMSYYWDFNTSKFVPSNRYEYAYNGTGQLIELVSYWFDDYLMVWVSQWKQEKSWSANGNLATNLSYYWDEVLMQWLPDYRETLIHDNAWPAAWLAIPYQYSMEASEYFTHLLSEMKYEFYNGMAWEDNQKAVLYWSPHNLIGIEEVVAPVFNIYPNPAGSYLNIRATGYEGDVLFELYDMSGRRVTEQKTPSTGRVSLGNLNNGVYVARISADEGVVFQGKVVVKN